MNRALGSKVWLGTVSVDAVKFVDPFLVELPGKMNDDKAAGSKLSLHVPLWLRGRLPRALARLESAEICGKLMLECLSEVPEARDLDHWRDRL